jgi:hypothetical protein
MLLAAGSYWQRTLSTKRRETEQPRRRCRADDLRVDHPPRRASHLGDRVPTERVVRSFARARASVRGATATRRVTRRDHLLARSRRPACLHRSGHSAHCGRDLGLSATLGSPLRPTRRTGGRARSGPLGPRVRTHRRGRLIPRPTHLSRRRRRRRMAPARLLATGLSFRYSDFELALLHEIAEASLWRDSTPVTPARASGQRHYATDTRAWQPHRR